VVVRSGATTMKMIGTLIFMLAAFGSFGAVHAEQFGTAEEARAMLDRAVAALNSNRTRALSEFNDTKNTQFHDRDLLHLLLQHGRRQIHGVSESRHNRRRHPGDEAAE